MTAADPGVVVAVVGMAREARILAPLAAVVAGAGGGTLQARIEAAAGGRIACVLSFGLCGALDPSLGVGDLLVGEAVIDGPTEVPTDPAWTRRLLAALPAARLGALAAADRPVASAAAKAALRAATGAAAVDMESAAAARAAIALGAPLAILRAVSDGAGRALPPAARVGLRADGRPDLPAVLGSLGARPWQLAALVRTALEAAAGFAALEGARDLLGPGLGGPDLDQPLLDVV